MQEQIGTRKLQWWVELASGVRLFRFENNDRDDAASRLNRKGALFIGR